MEFIMTAAIAQMAATLTTDKTPAKKTRKPAAKKVETKSVTNEVAINPVAIMESLGLDVDGSVSKAVNDLGMYFNESENKLASANTIITSLGGTEMSNELEADMMAKALIEQVMKTKESYSVEAAVTKATEKVARVLKKMPELKVAKEVTEVPTTTPSGRANKNNNEKKANAKVIYDRMNEGTTSQSAIAKQIASELDITFANAFYYVSRVFGKK
jgi:hypothetical protein